jgi:hypothetical protein
MKYRSSYGIDHRILFLAGFIFYFLTPVVAGRFNFFSGHPGIILYQDFFQMIPTGKLNQYFLITTSWLVAFFIGDYVFKFTRKNNNINLQKFQKTSTDTVIPLLAAGLFVILIIFTFLSRNSILGGYSSYDISARGKMSSLLVLYSYFLTHTLLTKNCKSVLLISGLLVTALLLLSMGGRLYVFQTLVVFIVYKTSFSEKRWKFWQLLPLLAIGFLAGGLAGVWRLGQSSSVERILYSFFAEPIFTWISTASFLVNNSIPIVNFPSNFITSFINIIPNTTISLTPYIISTQAMVKGYQSPLGADSLWTNVIINFGIAGSIFFFFITGFLLHWLKFLSQKSRSWAVYYLMICGIIPFQLFRDGFYLLHKQIYFNFLLLPALIILMMKLVLLIQIHTLQKDSKKYLVQ